MEEAQNKVREIQDKIQDEEPKLIQFEKDLIEQNEKLKLIISQTNIKREEVAVASHEQDIKVKTLEKMNEEIRIEKFQTEREKDEALKLAETFSNRDISEVNAYNNPPEPIS